MPRRKVLIVAVLVAVAVAVALVFWLRRAVPRPARMLPEADGYLYVDLRPMRAVGLFDRLNAIPLEPEYQDFVKRTGIQVERDLDQVAFAVHLGQGPEAPLTRSSEVFVGRFDAAKLGDFLQSIAARTEDFQGHTIFEVPLPGRTVRAAILGSWGMGASNAASAEPIQHILQSYLAWFHRSPALLREYYPRVPVGSPVWVVLRASSQESQSGQGGVSGLTLPGGFRIPVPEGTVAVASLRYSGNVQFRVEAFTPNADEAERLASHLGAYLAVFRALRSRMNIEGAGEELQKFVESIELHQEDERVILSASASPKLLEQIFAPLSDQGGATNPK